MAEWTRISPDHPDEYTFSLASKTGVGCRLIEADYEAVVVWAFRGGAWERLPPVARDIGSNFALVYDESINDFVVFHHDHRESVVQRFCLSDPSRTQTITHDAFQNDYPDSFSVVWHAAEGRAALLFHHHVLAIPAGWEAASCTPEVLLEDDALEYWALGYDPHRGQVFATRATEARLQYIVDGALESSAWCGEMLSTAAYVESQGSICALCREDESSDELWGILQLHTMRDGTWSPEPLRFDTGEALNTRLVLFSDPDTGRLVAYGSMDDSSGGSSYQVTLVTAGKALVPVSAEAHLRAPHTVLSHTAEGLLLHDLSADMTHRLAPSGEWSPLWKARRAEPQPVLGRDALVGVSPDGTHYALHQYHGTLHKRGSTPSARWRQLTRSSKGGPGTTHLRRMSLGWDPAGERPVVFAGYDDDRTYTVSGKAWVEISGAQRPGLGLGSMATTPEGLYLACYAELWRLSGDEWVCVGQLPEGQSGEDDDFWKKSIRHALCHDPRRGVLLAAYERPAADDDEQDTALIGWLDAASGDWRDAVVLPGDVSIETLGGLEVDMEIDPLRDELVLMGVDHAYRVSLSALGLPEAGELPTAAVAPATELIDPPASSLSPAWRLAPVEGGQPIQPSSLPLPFALPEDAKLLAVLPYHAEMKSGRRWFDALVLLETFDDAFVHASPIRPLADYMASIKVVPITGWSPEAPLCAFSTEDTLQPAAWQAYQELEPQPHGARIYKMRDADRWAEKTKMGGWARYFRRISGPEMDRVSLQLESRLAGNMIYVRLWQGGGEFDIERI